MKRKTIQLTRDNIRLSIVHQVYKQRTHYTKMPDGELIPEKREKLQKEMTVHKWFKRDAIISVEEYVTVTHQIAKSRSIITDKYTGRSFVTYHSPTEILSQISPDYKPITGFQE